MTWLEERLEKDELLLVPGAFDALSALCLQRAGVEAVYLGSYAMTAATLGGPDIGILGFGEVLEVVRRVREATDLPLVVDADTGYGGPHNVARTVRELARIGIDAVQIEDQVNPKRCGHLAGKAVVPLDEAMARIEAAVGAAEGSRTAIIARTDALAPLGLDAAVDRCRRFRAAGAVATFVDAVTDVEQIQEIRGRVEGPLVFNGADTGLSPTLSPSAAAQLGLSAMLLPVQALFAAWAAVSRYAAELVRSPADLVPATSGGRDFHALNDLLGLPALTRWERGLGAGARPTGRTAPPDEDSSLDP